MARKVEVKTLEEGLAALAWSGVTLDDVMQEFYSMDNENRTLGEFIKAYGCVVTDMNISHEMLGPSCVEIRLRLSGDPYVPKARCTPTKSKFREDVLAARNWKGNVFTANPPKGNGKVSVIVCTPHGDWETEHFAVSDKDILFPVRPGMYRIVEVETTDIEELKKKLDGLNKEFRYRHDIG